MQLLALAKRGWLGLAVVLGALYFFGLGAIPLVGPDEPRYAQVAREMFERGDWITPTLAGHHWFEKPALVYWSMMAGYSVFGVSEFAARFGSALSGVLTVALVGWLASRVEARAGHEIKGFAFTCAVVTASSAGLVVFSRGASFDSPLTMTVTAAAAAFFLATEESEVGKRRRLMLAFHAAIGATMLAKGLVGPVIVYGVAIVYLLLRRKRPTLSEFGSVWGLLVTLVVAAVWYGPVIARHETAFVDEFFIQHHLARYTSNKYHHPQPFYFYIPIMAMLALPWTGFLAKGLWKIRETAGRADEPLARLATFGACWLLVPIVFFSLSGSKLPGYVLPALPGGAIVAAVCVFKYLLHEGGQQVMRFTGALAFVVSAGVLVYAFSGFDSFAVSGVSQACALGLALPIGIAGAIALLAPRRRMLCFAAITTAAFLTILIVVGCAAEPFAERQSVKPLIEKADAEGLGSLPVFLLHAVERTSEFYAAGRLAYDETGEPIKYEGAWQIFDELRRRNGEGLVLVPNEFVSQLTSAEGVTARMLADNGELTVVYVRVR